MNKLIIFIAIVFFSQFSFGQTNQGKPEKPAPEIEDEEWYVIKPKNKIVLPEANRNFEKISLEPPQLTPVKVEYDTKDIDLDLPKLTTKVAVPKMSQPPIKKLYGNYVKAGFGNYTTPYLEGFFNNKRSEKYAYGIHLKHFSSQHGPVEKSISGLSQNVVDGYARYFAKTYELYSKLSYTRDRYNFYGFNQEQPVNKDTLKHLFHTINFMAGIKNKDINAPIGYDLAFNYFNFSDNLKAKENEFLVSGGGAYKIDDEKSVVVNQVMLSISSRKDSTTNNRGLFQIKPAFVLDKGKYIVTAGLNFAYSNDTIGSNKFHVYPRIEAEMPVIAGTFSLFGGITGEMQKNVLRTFTYQNPYLQSNVPLSNTNKTIDLFAGGKGNYKGLNYKGKISYANYKNLFFFNNSFTDTSKFTILYDKNTTVLNLEADVNYEWDQVFRIGANVNYYSYNLSTYNKPFQRPSFISTLSAGYNLYKKIYFNTEIYYISGLTGKNFVSNKEVKMKDIFDLNLKVNYKFSGVFSAFLEVNNILSNKYQRYLYYPVKGINVIGGIAYSF